MSRVCQWGYLGVLLSSNYMERLRARNAALDPNEEADPELVKKFLSMVISILWGTQRSMPQLGVNSSFLAGEAKQRAKQIAPSS